LAGHSGPGWDDRFNLLLKPDAFISFSSHQYNWATRHSRGVNLATIPHWVDTKKFNPKGNKAKIKLPRPIFATVSALSPGGRAGETVKNIDKTIQAVSKLDHGSFLLLGQGADQKRIDKLGKKLLGLRYQRLTVSHNIINTYYRSADVFTLFSSSTEAFGLVYLEALASGLPVVAPDDNLRRQIIGSAGILIDKDVSVGEYSQALKQAAAKNWGQLPQTQAQKFSWEKVRKQYVELFNNVVNEN
jgi:glycosyltransferase involved in cell wall biosynthesis